MTHIRLSELSENQAALSGNLSLAGMKRLSERLQLALNGDLSYRLECERDMGGRLLMQATLSATLSAFCQRCLEMFDFSVQKAQRFYLRNSDGEACPDDCEIIDLKDDLFVADFLEDELILSVPIAPTHALAVCPAARFVRQ